MPAQVRVSLLGNIVTKPLTLRYYASGKAVIELVLLVKRHWQDKAGKTQERSDYIPLLAQGEVAERISQTLPGQSLLIDGKLMPRKDPQGEWSWKVEVDRADCLGIRAQTYWNRAQVAGKISLLSTVKQSVNQHSMLQLNLIVSQQVGAPDLLAQVWGRSAERLAKQGQDTQLWISDGSIRQTGKKGHEQLHFESSVSLLGIAPEQSFDSQ